MFYQDKKLTDFVYVNKNAIPNDLCDFLIKKSNSYSWEVHSTYDFERKLNNFGEVEIGNLHRKEDDDKNLFRAAMDKVTKLQITPILEQSIAQYRELHKIVSPIKFTSVVQLNKYENGAHMKEHVDHIYSCFDGTRKGIPILSIVGLLNDDFQGGEFIFWGDHTISLNKGDLLLFPSLFLYPHAVKPVSKGLRYSLVAWCW